MPLSLPVLSSKSFSPATRRPLTLCNLHCNCSSSDAADTAADVAPDAAAADREEGLEGVDEVYGWSGLAVISVAKIE